MEKITSALGSPSARDRKTSGERRSPGAKAELIGPPRGGVLSRAP
jgi:hypothetical protein